MVCWFSSVPKAECGVGALGHLHVALPPKKTKNKSAAVVLLPRGIYIIYNNRSNLAAFFSALRSLARFRLPPELLLLFFRQYVFRYYFYSAIRSANQMRSALGQGSFLSRIFGGNLNGRFSSIILCISIL